MFGRRRHQVLAALERPIRPDRARLVLEKRTRNPLPKVVQCKPLPLLVVHLTWMPQSIEQSSALESLARDGEARSNRRLARLRQTLDQLAQVVRFRLGDGDDLSTACPAAFAARDRVSLSLNLARGAVDDGIVDGMQCRQQVARTRPILGERRLHFEALSHQ